MNPPEQERGTEELEDSREARSELDPQSLAQALASRAEELIPKEGDAASALEEVSDVLSQGSSPDNLNRAQQALEQQNEWSPATRELALEISQLEQRESRELPITFADAVDKLRGLGRADVEDLVEGLDSTDDSEKVEAIGKLLGIVEELMAAFPDAAVDPGVDKAQLKEYRAIRNALVLEQEELNIRIEKAEAEALEAFEGEDDEEDAKANVAAVYKKIKGSDSKESSGGVQELDEQDMLDKFENYDLQDMMWYESQNFRLDQRTKQQVPSLKAFVTKRLQMASTEIPTTSYSGSVTDIMGETGQALDFLRLVASTKNKGQMIARNEFSKMSFLDVASTIGLNVYKYVPDYDKRFAGRR